MTNNRIVTEMLNDTGRWVMTWIWITCTLLCPFISAASVHLCVVFAFVIINCRCLRWTLAYLIVHIGGGAVSIIMNALNLRHISHSHRRTTWWSPWPWMGQGICASILCCWQQATGSTIFAVFIRIHLLMGFPPCFDDCQQTTNNRARKHFYRVRVSGTDWNCDRKYGFWIYSIAITVCISGLVILSDHHPSRLSRHFNEKKEYLLFATKMFLLVNSTMVGGWAKGNFNWKQHPTAWTEK